MSATFLTATAARTTDRAACAAQEVASTSTAAGSRTTCTPEFQRPPPPFAACRYRVLTRALAAHESDCTAALRQTRVTMFAREGYFEASPAATSDEPVPNLGFVPSAAFELVTPQPTVLNEARLRAVECHPGLPNWGRLAPAFHVFASLNGEHWEPLVVEHGDNTKDMESRALVLRNVPRRHLSGSELLERTLALPREQCWAEALACTDLSFAVARALLERKSKLKNFLVRAADGGACKLKGWPGKDGVQAMAAWWLAALLVDAHAYTEPELYASVEAECAYPPDLGTIRKELVRRGCLQQPEIVQNPDMTTSTFYRIDAEGMRSTMEREWRKL